jgi:nitroimidazol reductase NimA-like FMN-containing flavoprotein (pyridoxamine 5'-phosphate oxidase superfamily)
MMSANADTQALLEDPVAVELLASTVPARLAYTWFDGTPRVVPIWFHWDGVALTLGCPIKAPKIGALEAHPAVALTIDSATFPYHALFLRGTAEVTREDDMISEYASSAERYFGPEQGRAWADSLRGKPMARIRIVPTWVNILDFETRFPSALSA